MNSMWSVHCTLTVLRLVLQQKQGFCVKPKVFFNQLNKRLFTCVRSFQCVFLSQISCSDTRLESAGPSYCWNELITLSTKYRDLTAHSQLALTVSKKKLFLLSHCIVVFKLNSVFVGW